MTYEEVKAKINEIMATAQEEIVALKCDGLRSELYRNFVYETVNSSTRTAIQAGAKYAEQVDKLQKEVV